MTFRTIVSALAVAAGLTLPAAASAATYTETFPSSGANQQQSLADAGWCGGNAGDAYCQAPTGGEGAISSSGLGPDGAVGFAFWSQTGVGADSFLFTDEFTFRTSQKPVLSWYQRDGGASDPMRVALLIGTDWYISDTVYRHASATDWLLQTADLGSMTWFVRETFGNTSVLPGGDVEPGGVVLPADQLVSAFGFWWDGRKTATSRIDDVSVSVVPVPGALPLLLAGLGGLAVMSRRRKAG